MHNMWELRQQNSENSKEMQELYSIHPIAADILAARGLDAEHIESYFVPQALEDPFALTDMDLAVERINAAIDSGEKIAVYGDYDCDGITSCYIVYNYLTSMGVEVIPYIPERDQGYGITKEGLDFVKNQGATLVITVDSGITAIEEAKYCKSLGMDLVITDHHMVGDKLPEAAAVVNPKREDDSKGCFKDLAGAGVAFKLIAAMQDGDYESAFELAGDFAAIGTISDIMPLVGENRTIVKRGLSLLRYTENIGLRALFDVMNLSLESITAGQVGFRVSPLINAAGRIAEAQEAFKLLILEDEAEAMKVAESLRELVVKRRKMEEEIFEGILNTMDKEGKTHDPVLVFWGDYPSGLVGLVCSRLLTRFGKPAIVFSVNGEQAHGSSRSLRGFSIYQAIKENQNLCLDWGGHELAAGMTVLTKDLEAFRQGINDFATKQEMPTPTRKIDRVLSPADMNLELAKELEKFEPFGSENPAPTFLIKNVTLEEIKLISNGAHARLCFSAQGNRFETILFQIQNNPFLFSKGTVLDLIGQLKVNRYGGRECSEFQMLDYWPSDTSQKEYFSQLHWSDAAIKGNPFPPQSLESLFPQREEFALVYRFLRENAGEGKTAPTLYEAFLRNKIPYGKWRIILEVLKREKLICIRPDGTNLKLLPVEKKVNLENSELLKRLRIKR